ncbi:MAG TPA: Gmad2 immunoglobulin-like domain-containing protein [Nocardioides sp.]|nr:Gmad2 immunoglobulin-like domain-containing protein [Nocardioides sp.]
MTPIDDQHDELRELLTDAVSDVEPAYRLGEIRARVHRPARRGWYAAGGAILAAAAVVTAVNLGESDDVRRDNAPPAADVERTAALYFVGDTPAGPRLYREFQKVTGGPIADLEAITRENGPVDPDYSTLWPAGLFTSVTVRDDAIEVGLGEWTGPEYDIDQDYVHALLQAVVYTAQAATGESLPVQLTENGEPAGDPFGVVPGTGPIERDPQNDILALVNISDPVEGAIVTGDSFVARGRANSFEGTVPWQIRTEQGVVQEGSTTAEGTGDRLYPWETEIDISDLDPGHYTFVAKTDDPTGGTEGFGPFTDTRTIIVE